MPAAETHVLDLLRVLGDPTRLRILSLLGEDEICVCHIHASLDVPQPTARVFRGHKGAEIQRSRSCLYVPLQSLHDSVFRLVRILPVPVPVGMLDK